MNNKERKIFGGNAKEGAELNVDVFKTAYNFFKLLTPQISESKRLSAFAGWQGLDSRTVKKYLREAERVKKPKAMLKLSDNKKYLETAQNHLEPKSLWRYLEGCCEVCELRGAEGCTGKAPANGCIYYCKNCKHKSGCEQKKGTNENVPEDCKILAYEFERIDNAAALPYFYVPLKYILALKDSEVLEDNEVLEELNHLIESLEKFLEGNFNFKYISCIIRYAYLYNLIDHLPPEQEGAEPTENPITWLFAYSRRSLSISRVYNEKALEDVLRQIVTDSIDDEQVKLWKECDDFKKDLLKSQEVPELGSVNDLLEYAKEDISIADIVIFLSHFADISLFKLRLIDIEVLQKCLCWKDYSFEKFLKKLPQLPEHLEEWFSKN